MPFSGFPEDLCILTHTRSQVWTRDQYFGDRYPRLAGVLGNRCPCSGNRQTTLDRALFLEDTAPRSFTITRLCLRFLAHSTRGVACFKGGGDAPDGALAFASSSQSVNRVLSTVPSVTAGSAKRSHTSSIASLFLAVLGLKTAKKQGHSYHGQKKGGKMVVLAVQLSFKPVKTVPSFNQSVDVSRCAHVPDLQAQETVLNEHLLEDSWWFYNDLQMNQYWSSRGAQMAEAMCSIAKFVSLACEESRDHMSHCIRLLHDALANHTCILQDGSRTTEINHIQRISFRVTDEEVAHLRRALEFKLPFPRDPHRILFGCQDCYPPFEADWRGSIIMRCFEEDFTDPSNQLTVGLCRLLQPGDTVHCLDVLSSVMSENQVAWSVFVVTRRGWSRVRLALKLRAIVLYWLDLTKHLMAPGQPRFLADVALFAVEF